MFRERTLGGAHVIVYYIYCNEVGSPVSVLFVLFCVFRNITTRPQSGSAAVMSVITIIRTKFLYCRPTILILNYVKTK
jgi:hypothetical protein